ncbi:hypothetical protein KY310_04665, partial [Candidatus Woesearchaeota archaeon]|nr:hypothetical protein [Candidatus Woesearchaeota archaeon]
LAAVIIIMRIPGASLDRKKEKYCPMFDAPLDNLKLMTRYIQAIPRQGIVVLDNNIIPDADIAQLKRTKSDSIEGIVMLNSAIAEVVQNFASDRVIITREARKEMNAGFDFMQDEIKKMSGNSSLYRSLLESYVELHKKVNAPKRLEETAEQEGTVIYDAMKSIVRKLVLDFPELKKEPSSGDEPDERIVAYAFAEAIAQDKKVYILSSDPDIRNIAAELYAVLSCRNVVGVDTISGQRLNVNNVEVVCFDPAKNLFRPVYNAKEHAPKEWVPKKGYSAKDKAEFIKFVQTNLIDVEAALGNGIALAALVKQKETAPSETAAPKKDAVVVEKPGKEVDVLKALERIYATAGIDPEKLTVDDQDKIIAAIGVCKDFQVVYKRCGLPTDSLDEEIRQLEGKTIEKLIESAETDLKNINEQIIALRQNPEYLRALETDPIRVKEQELEQEFASKQQELFNYTQKCSVSVPFNIANLDESARAFVESLEKAGAEVIEQGIWASNTQIQDAIGWPKIKVSRVLVDLGKKDKLKREVRGGYTFNLLTSDIIKELLSE